MRSGGFTPPSREANPSLLFTEADIADNLGLQSSASCSNLIEVNLTGIAGPPDLLFHCGKEGAVVSVGGSNKENA